MNSPTHTYFMNMSGFSPCFFWVLCALAKSQAKKLVIIIKSFFFFVILQTGEMVEF